MGDLTGLPMALILPPKVQAKQGLLTPPATKGCPSITQSMALSSQVCFQKPYYFFPRKRCTSPFPLCFACLTTEQRTSNGEQGRQTHQQQVDVLVKLIWEGLLPVRTQSSVTQPQLSLGAHLGTLAHFLASGLRLLMSPRSLMLHLIIYAFGDTKHYQTYTL